MTIGERLALKSARATLGGERAWHVALLTVQSMAAILNLPFSDDAALSHAGFRFLQCPHHGA